MRDGAVVVWYNPTELDCQNVQYYANKVYITIVIDNSRESHLDILDKIIPIDNKSVIYRHFPENIGLCAAVNRGIRELYQKGCNWVLTMDADSSFRTDILNIFRSYVRHHNCSEIILLAPQYNYDRHRVKVYEGNKTLSWAMMSGNYVQAELFIKIGGFLEQLFVYGLDMELCYWARKNGYKAVECGQAVLEHNPGEPRELNVFGKTVLKYGQASPWRYYMSARAAIFLIRKYRAPCAIKDYFFKLAKIILLFEDKKEYLKYFYKGTIEGFRLEGRG